MVLHSVLPWLNAFSKFYALIPLIPITKLRYLWTNRKYVIEIQTKRARLPKAYNLSFLILVTISTGEHKLNHLFDMSNICTSNCHILIFPESWDFFNIFGKEKTDFWSWFFHCDVLVTELIVYVVEKLPNYIHKNV